MKNAHDITSGWPSRQPRAASADPAGLQVDGVFFGLIEGVADADREALLRMTPGFTATSPEA
jgi:hypothetical protein